MLSFLKKIDLLKIVFLLTITSVFYMYSNLYYVNCFPNCYAWKELMIKWSHGEMIRRGLLGSFFYWLEPNFPIKYSATIIIYSCLIICSNYIYNCLKRLSLPVWLFISILFSPALFLFNLHPSLVYKKDIIAIAGTVILLSYINYYWNHHVRQNNNLQNSVIVFCLIYMYIYTFFLLCYEVIFVFVPFICMYAIYIISMHHQIKIAIKISVFLCFISAFLFLFFTILYIGDQEIVLKILGDWSIIYPNLKLGQVDPFDFLMMNNENLKVWHHYIWERSKLWELVLVYILMILPLIIIYKMKLVTICIHEGIKNAHNKHYYILMAVVLLSVHFPLILSVVAFDYGRWLIFCFYLMIFFLGLFTKRNKNLNSKNKKFSLFLLLLIWSATFAYLVTWQPYHWAGDEGHLINMNEYYIFSNLYYFYSNMSNLFLIFH